MELQIDRVIIYPSDIRRWYGISERASYTKYRDIKLQIGIPVKKPLTIFHYRDFSNLTLEDILRMLRS